MAKNCAQFLNCEIIISQSCEIVGCESLGSWRFSFFAFVSEITRARAV